MLTNRLPVCVVNSLPVDSFKINLNRFWCNHDIYCNYKVSVARTEIRSIVM